MDGEEEFPRVNSGAIVFEQGRDPKQHSASRVTNYFMLSKVVEEVSLPQHRQHQSRSRSVEGARNSSLFGAIRDRSVEAHVLYRAHVSNSHCLAAQLSFVGQDCKRLPPVLARLYGPRVLALDLSYNCLTTLAGVEHFPALEELILDNNQLPDSMALPSLPKLHTLSLNKNCINNLDLLLTKISHNLPSLRYLSLLGNKACPDELSDQEKDEEDYQRYRYYVLHQVPKLQFLDSRPVSTAEKEEAQRRGQFMRVVRPSIVHMENADIDIRESILRETASFRTVTYE